jgi:hypothetical protein
MSRFYDAMRKSGHACMIAALRDRETGVEFRDQLCTAVRKSAMLYSYSDILIRYRLDGRQGEPTIALQLQSIFVIGPSLKVVAS